MRREMRLLPALAARVSFRVPEPVHVTDDWFVYEKIPGRTFAVGDDINGALAMIEELHSFPVEEARRLLDRPSRVESFATTKAMFEATVIPRLEADLVERARFLCEPPPLEREVFIHDDLGPVHVLVDDGGQPVGIIDFEDATIGDPEVDRMPVSLVAGRPLTERGWFYWCRSVLHDIAYYGREGKPEEVPAMVDRLRRRLDSRPGQ
jgi:aminoglycoside phosphotransferase (APT) family kinase protein